MPTIDAIIDTVAQSAVDIRSELPDRRLLEPPVEQHDRDETLAALVQREQETSRGVGQGTVIPHTQTDAVDRPSVAFVRSSVGLDFDSMDERAATLVLMSLVPAGKSDEHRTILSSLSRSLMNEGAHDVYDAETPMDVQRVMQEAIT